MVSADRKVLLFEKLTLMRCDLDMFDMFEMCVGPV
jgi:hypothetical protein